VDKVSNEPEDLRYGKFIYDAINNLYVNAGIDDPRVRELFFAEVYKLEDDEFFPFVENAVNDALNNTQKLWDTNTMRDIARDLTKDDTGLEDLD
jgi:UDP-glucose 6-dehydrogenase